MTSPSLTGADDCDNHTFQPEGYIEWHGWAEEMSKTHVQRQCHGCGLYMIWEPKPAVRAALERTPHDD